MPVSSGPGSEAPQTIVYCYDFARLPFAPPERDVRWCEALLCYKFRLLWGTFCVKIAQNLSPIAQAPLTIQVGSERIRPSWRPKITSHLSAMPQCRVSNPGTELRRAACSVQQRTSSENDNETPHKFAVAHSSEIRQTSGCYPTARGDLPRLERSRKRRISLRRSFFLQQDRTWCGWADKVRDIVNPASRTNHSRIPSRSTRCRTRSCAMAGWCSRLRSMYFSD